MQLVIVAHLFKGDDIGSDTCM